MFSSTSNQNRPNSVCFRGFWFICKGLITAQPYDMIKQLCIKRIHDKIRSTSPPNRAKSPTCLHCDVTHLSLTTGIVALHIPSWRVGVREEQRQACKTAWPYNFGRVICQNNLYGIIHHHKHVRASFFGRISNMFKYNHNDTYRHWREGCLTPGVVALHIPLSGTIITISRQTFTQSSYNTSSKRYVTWIYIDLRRFVIICYILRILISPIYMCLRSISRALEQSYDCPCAGDATMNNIDKQTSLKSAQKKDSAA